MTLNHRPVFVKQTPVVVGLWKHSFDMIVEIKIGTKYLEKRIQKEGQKEEPVKRGPIEERKQPGGGKEKKKNIRSRMAHLHTSFSLVSARRSLFFS